MDVEAGLPLVYFVREDLHVARFVPLGSFPEPEGCNGLSWIVLSDTVGYKH